jgi:hypothetical protein
MPGTTGTLTWEREGDAQASVAFRISESALTLCYHDQQVGELRDIEQHVVDNSSGVRRIAHLFSAPARTVAGEARYCISAEAYFSVGIVTVSPMRAKAKMRGEERADARTSSASD